MSINPSSRARAIQPSATIAVSTRARELRAAGRDVIGLGAGEPDFDTPEHIKQAAVAALARGDTKYTAVDGTPALKEAITRKFQRDNGLGYETAQVLVSCGAKHSIFNLLMALLDPGDEVIIPAPYWVSYPDMVTLCGGTPVTISAPIEQDFKINPEQLEAAITPSTRLLILNSPGNPTGIAYRGAELEALGAVLERHPRVVIASDDIYEHILWGDEPFRNLAMICPHLAGRTVVINGVSKAYAMTGWRIGYAAGPAKLIGAMKKIQSQCTSNPTSLAQAAAVAALDGGTACVAHMVAAFRERHDYVQGRLNAMPHVRCIAADGAFYAFPSVTGVLERLDGVEDDTALATFLLDKAEVAVVPGTAFGAPGHLRLSFATSMEALQTALDRIEAALPRG